jgi:hypothetical protein
MDRSSANYECSKFGGRQAAHSRRLLGCSWAGCLQALCELADPPLTGFDAALNCFAIVGGTVCADHLATLCTVYRLDSIVEKTLALIVYG